LVLRTVYIEPEVDDRLRDEEQQSGISKAELFRRYLRAGVRVLRATPELGPPPTRPPDAPPLVLRTVHVDAATWEWLRVQAFDAPVQSNEFVRWCLALGMQ
jgi:plasmid stabilization system protein ParE